ncbi:hypothetical protein SAMN05518849_101515 [Sphingobium sp. AP50]|uniref:hypothetical protein n=1 Tax=Sphingobium sp. AP50 TaxID=1884369 RepID=UPI0008B826D8|nr:hypothetical protein [Sphingobium sp. AP50]SEI67439.1 hypothetical protein SAMN05518849_101515 [Sphingobium sp. AP50]
MRQEQARSHIKVLSSSRTGAEKQSAVLQRSGGGRLFVYLPAALLLFAGLTGLGAASLYGGPDSGWYLVIAAPGSTRAQTINLVSAANGRLVQAGRFSNIVIAGSDRPDFPAALRKAGAWLAVAAPPGGGCLDPSTREQSL